MSFLGTRIGGFFKEKIQKNAAAPNMRSAVSVNCGIPPVMAAFATGVIAPKSSPIITRQKYGQNVPENAPASLKEIPFSFAMIEI